jgi:hypothetical protein
MMALANMFEALIHWMILKSELPSWIFISGLLQRVV